MYILNYKGRSPVSQLIKLVTWGSFSHTAICDIHGCTIEALEGKGLCISDTPWSKHKINTPVTVYTLPMVQTVADCLWLNARKRVGLKYDYRALTGFIPGLRWLWKDDITKWFCSHLVAQVCQEVNFNLFSPQTPLYKISPALVDTSVILKQVGEVHNMLEFNQLIQK